MHKKTAQAIAKTTSEVIGYGVLVTDERGIIIGCNDEKRVGTLHEPSLEVMRTGQPALTSKEDAARLEGVKPGYTAPIALSAQVVGTISIAAPPQRAERYGLLVRKQAEILLMEQTFLELKLRQQLAVRDLAESIMLYRPEDENTDMLLLHGKELGFDLERCRIAVILELQDLRRRPEGQDAFRDMALNCIINFFSNSAHLIAPLRNRQIVLFLALPCNRHEGEMEESAFHLCEALSDHMEKDGMLLEAALHRPGARDANLPGELARSRDAALLHSGGAQASACRAGAAGHGGHLAGADGHISCLVPKPLRAYGCGPFPVHPSKHAAVPPEETA